MITSPGSIIALSWTLTIRPPDLSSLPAESAVSLTLEGSDPSCVEDQFERDILGFNGLNEELFVRGFTRGEVSEGSFFFGGDEGAKKV